MGRIWGIVQGELFVWVHQVPNIILGRHQQCVPAVVAMVWAISAVLHSTLCSQEIKRICAQLESCSGAEPDLQAPGREGSVCVSLQLDQIMGNTEGLRDSLAQDGAAAGWDEKQNPGQKARHKTPLSCVSFKHHQGVSLSPTLSLPPPPRVCEPSTAKVGYFV